MQHVQALHPISLATTGKEVAKTLAQKEKMNVRSKQAKVVLNKRNGNTKGAYRNSMKAVGYHKIFFNAEGNAKKVVRWRDSSPAHGLPRNGNKYFGGYQICKTSKPLNSIKMTPEHLTTPVSAIVTTIAPTRRSSRIVSVPQAATTEYATQERKAEQAKKKRRRDSNVRRGEDAVNIRLESEKNAKGSGEKPKSLKTCCLEARYDTENPRKDLSRLVNAQRKKLEMTDSAMNTPTAMSEDEDDNDNDNDNVERDEKLNEEYWFKIFLSQTARSGVSGRPEKEGTQEEKAAMAEFTRTHRIKNLFETADDYATTFAAATMEILKIEFGMKGKRTRYVRKVLMLGTGCLATP